MRVIVKAPGDLTRRAGAGLAGRQAGLRRAASSARAPHTPLHLVLRRRHVGQHGRPADHRRDRRRPAAAGRGRHGRQGRPGRVRQLGARGRPDDLQRRRRALRAVVAQRPARAQRSTTASATAARLAGRDPAANRVVVVLSDGADTSSSLKLAALEQQLRASGVEVDAVGLTASGSYDASDLAAITDASGGAFAPAARSPTWSRSPSSWRRRSWPATTPWTWRFPTPAPATSGSRCAAAGRPHVSLPAGVSGRIALVLERARQPDRRAARVRGHPDDRDRWC